MGLHFGDHTASNRSPAATQRGNCIIRTPTRRRHAGSQFLMLQNPHRQPASCATSPTRPGRRADWREKTRPAQPLHPRFREKLARHAINRQLWPLFVRSANFFALASTIRPNRAKNVAHWAWKHERLERNIAPARGVKDRRETFFAHARSLEPFLTHFNRAGAMFLSLRMHARHWSNPLGRYFFQGQTKTTDRASDPDAPNQTTGPQPHWCGGRRRVRRARAGFEARRRTK